MNILMHYTSVHFLGYIKEERGEKERNFSYIDKSVRWWYSDGVFARK